MKNLDVIGSLSKAISVQKSGFDKLNLTAKYIFA